MDERDSSFGLSSKAKKNCKKCYGSGVFATMHLTGQKVPCSCVVKAAQEEAKILKTEV